jgi:hypothetical protein
VVKNWRIRLFSSIVIALLLPLPNPHVDDYVPLFRAIVHDPNWGDPTFWLLVFGIVGVYTGIVFAVLTAISLVRRRANVRGRSTD